MSRKVIELVQCDFCDVEDSMETPIVTKNWGYQGKSYETDVCPTHLEEIEKIFDDLTITSRRVTEGGTTRSVRKRKPFEGEPRFNQFKNDKGLFDCPYTWTDDHGEHNCHRRGDDGFTTPNGLAVHHARRHGVNL